MNFGFPLVSLHHHKRVTFASKIDRPNDISGGDTRQAHPARLGPSSEVPDDLQPEGRDFMRHGFLDSMLKGSL